MSERKEWLIRKGGYYYRANKSGYTTLACEAGRYTPSDAHEEALIEPWHMKAIHESEVPDDTPVRVAGIIATKDATIARLRAALERVAQWHGEFPETGEVWPDGTPVSYRAQHGYDGERDFMRAVARAALDTP